MANVTRTGNKSKDDDDKSKKRHIDGKCSSASGSTNSETSGLRRSSRETPSKKQRASSPLSTRKSERIEKRAPPTPPVKRSSERVEKQKMPSPLTKSERGENHRSSSSSGSKNSEKSSNSLGNKYKKEQRDNNERYITANTRDRKKDGEKNKRPVRIVLGKKRLDARSYRNSLLKPQANKTQESGLSEKLKEHDETSQVDSDHAGTSSSKEVDGVAELWNEEFGGKDAEGPGRAVEGPSSALRKLEPGSSSILAEMELSPSSEKRKIHLVLAKETVSETVLVERDKLLNASTGSTSEGRSISGDQCLGEAYTLGTSKRKRESEELDSDASMTPANEEISYSADPVTSPPSESKKSNPGCCNACSKRQRFEVDSQKCNMCSCKHGRNPHSYNSPPEEVREQAANSAVQGAYKINVDHIDQNSREDVNGSELLLETKRNIAHDLPDGHITPTISDPLEESGGELSSRACVGLNEGCLDKMQLKESPLDSEMEYDHTACVICKLGGNLLCCNGKGCKRNYHLSCLDPPLKFVSLGVWNCFQCIKRKIQFGVHFVSEGVESIWDVREEEVRDCEGIQKQNQYLVKYKGLAHVHNRWIPEQQLVLEAPSLVAEFKKSQVLKWNSEWTKPQRLVQKRSLKSSQNQLDETFSDCQYEWFVKWSGLGYEHATWELDNAPFLSPPEAITLIRDYESRLEKAIWASDPSREKLLEEKKASFLELSKLPSTNVPGLDNDRQNFVNKLCEYWHKNHHAVIVDDQERILKVVLFILSMQPNVCRPFLIISTSCAISAWETEFMRSAPSVNVVTYGGNKDVREGIRGLEFYEDGGCVMLQVLLSPIDAIVEDLEALELVRWEAIVVDECQQSRVSRNFEQIKKLTNGFKLLLLNGAVKESVPEYLNLLSFIESGGERNGDLNMKDGSVDAVSKLKERFARFIAYERKSDSSRCVEYWVPVHLSNVQLEQYCATLLSNSISLCSCSKNDLVGALRDILISVRKCCDHPYLVDQSLQGVLMKGLPAAEYLDVGINASGKLQVLDKILPEIRKRGLRVLILFQSIGGSGRNCIGDILDDFLRQRFGADSYERVDSGLATSKRQAALNMFNNKDRGRFVFLLENRACKPSIKLSSVDMAILFDSDWNPLNDLRSLQKITMDSEVEQLKVFRLYSSCTVEEKVLSLAKQEMTLDSNIQNISRSTSHMLLFWGACFLFRKLDEFHRDCTQFSTSNISSDQSLLNDVVQEVLSQLPNNAEIIEQQNCKVISKAQQSGSSYSKEIMLLGEKEIRPRDENLPHILWTNVLDGRYPRWRFASDPSQRTRRKVQYFDESPRKLPENDEVVKKRKRAVNNNNDPNTLKSCFDNKRKPVSVDKEGGSDAPTCDGPENVLASAANPNYVDHPVSNQAEMHMVDSNERRNLRDSQKNLHISLKPVISDLCDSLQLPVDVKNMAAKFLEYIMNNHAVPREPETIFQALQISLCWSAASLLKYKISHKKSLTLAKEHLNFQCKEEETNLIYSKLSMMRKMFTQQAKSVELVSADNSSPRDEEKRHSHFRDTLSTSAQHELEDGEIRETPKTQKCCIQLDSSKQQAAGCENASGSSKDEFSKSIKKVEKIHTRRMRKLYQKQMEEFEKFNSSREKFIEKEKADLEIKRKLESLLVRNLNSQRAVRDEKLKIIDQDFARKSEELIIRMETQRKKLEAMHRTARNEEKNMKAHWLEEAKCGKSVAEYEMLPLSDSEFRVENIEELEQVVVNNENLDSGSRVEDIAYSHKVGVGHEKETVSSRSSLERQDTIEVVSVLPAEAVSEIAAMEPPPFTIQLDETVDEMNIPDQEHAARSKDGQVPSLQVPVNMHAESSLLTAGLQGVEVSVREVNNSSQVENRTSQSADAIPPNLLNGDTPTKPPAVQLELFPSADPLSTEQSQPDMPTCTWVGCERTNESIQQFEAPIQTLIEDQDVIIDHSGPLPDNQFNASSQQTQTATPLVDLPATEQSQTELPTNRCTETEQRDERSTSLTQFEAQRCSAGEDQNELISHSDLPPDNQPRHSAAEPTIHSAQPLSIEQMELLNHSGSQSQLHVTSQQIQVAAPLSVPISTERRQSEEPVGTGIDREQSNERLISHLQLEAQIQSPVEGQNELVNPSAAQLIQVSVQPPAMEQTELLNHFVSQTIAQSSMSGTGSRLSDPRSLSHFPEFSPRPQHISPVSSQIPQQLCPDLFQTEIGRLQKEEQEAIKTHEDEKLRLNSDCEKEMEEIRRKYNNLIHDAEMEYLQRKKKLETNQNIISMNRILAEAFRVKSDAITRIAGAPALQQGASPGSAQQGIHFSSPHAAQRSAAMPGPLTAPPAAPPVQMVRQPFALFSGNPVRSQFSQVLFPSGNHQSGTELRAPAPHLQPFRPNSFTPAPSLSPLSSMLPGQQSLSSATTTSSIHPQRIPHLPTQMSVPFSRAHQLENMGGLRAPHNSSLPTLELLMDMERHLIPNRQSLSHVQDIGLTIDTRETPELTTTGGLHGPVVHAGSSADIVCLSDDD